MQYILYNFPIPVVSGHIIRLTCQNKNLTIWRAFLEDLDVWSHVCCGDVSEGSESFKSDGEREKANPLKGISCTKTLS